MEGEGKTETTHTTKIQIAPTHIAMHTNTCRRLEFTHEAHNQFGSHQPVKSIFRVFICPPSILPSLSRQVWKY